MAEAEKLVRILRKWTRRRTMVR